MLVWLTRDEWNWFEICYGLGQNKRQRQGTPRGLPLVRDCGLGSSMLQLAVDMQFHSHPRTPLPSAAADYCLEWAHAGRRSLLRASLRHCQALRVLAALEEQSSDSLKVGTWLKTKFHLTLGTHCGPAPSTQGFSSSQRYFSFGRLWKLGNVAWIIVQQLLKRSKRINNSRVCTTVSIPQSFVCFNLSNSPGINLDN